MRTNTKKPDAITILSRNTTPIRTLSKWHNPSFPARLTSAGPLHLGPLSWPSGHRRSRGRGGGHVSAGVAAGGGSRGHLGGRAGRRRRTRLRGDAGGGGGGDGSVERARTRPTRL